MIDTDKYEGHIEGPWFDGEATKISNAIANGIMQKFPNDIGMATLQLAVDAPLLLAEVKRLREAIADIATNMEAADASYMGGFIEDLLKVIE